TGYALKLTRMRVSSENDEASNTITLDESGGTLMLDFQPPGRPVPDSSNTPYLVHNGAIEAAATLVGWSQANISGHGPGVVETVETGVYALCYLADPAELTTLWLGALPSDRCSSGVVEQDGTLNLSPR